MKKGKEEVNKFIINRYMILYIYISSIVIYFILNLIINNPNINIPLIFRTYYISLGMIVFMFLKQLRKIHKKYISQIMMIFFSLMIFICAFEFIMDSTEIRIFNEPSKYLISSKESILIIESFACCALSEYYLKKKELKKLSYALLMYISISAILIYLYDPFLYFIKKINIVIEIGLFVKVSLNFGKSNSSKEEGWNIIKIYICSTTIIFMLLVYRFYFNDSYLNNILIEIIHFINFRIIWNIVIFRLIKKPYTNLWKSLSEENEELDNLNHKIVMSNKMLEKSIKLLENKEYLYFTYFKFMPHPIIILNSKNDRILFVNKQFLKFAGIEKEREIINKHINNYIEFLEESKANDLSYNAIFYSGDRRKYIEAKYLLNYEEPTKKLILIKDNTAKVQTEEIKKKVEDKRVDENIRKEFLSSISHDLKTPINVIYSAMQVERIYISKRDISVLRKYNNICKQNCISLIKLTNNLIDNSKINSSYLSPRMEKINMVETIEDTVMSLVDYVKLNNIDLIFDTNTEECYLNIDHNFMDRIILNLISNAVKFTPDGGKICVIIEDKTEMVKILVKDSGSGIDEEFIQKAFNRYSVGKNHRLARKNCTGIGLSVVKQLVELQGGSIEIKRNEDIGTTVSIEFKKENGYV